MIKNRILFLGTSLYLSNPQYLAIIPELKNSYRIFLKTNDPATALFDKSYFNKQEIKKNYDYIINVNPPKFELESWWRAYPKYKRLLNKILYKINPSAIISCSDMTLSDRIVSAWCIKNKKPFIILQPSFIDITAPKKYGFKDISRYLIVNKILRIPRYRRQRYFGQESQKTYLLLWSNYFIENPKRKNTFIIGNPAFDPLFKNFSPQRKIKNRIIICTQLIEVLFGEKLADKVNNIYLEAIKTNPEVEFIIKLHPRESLTKYDHIFNQNKFSNIKIIKSQNLYEIFRTCDVQISVSSFTSFEAAAMGLPIIIVNPHNKIRFLDHFREEIEFRVNDIEDIKKAVELSLSEKYWKEFLEKRNKYFKKMLSSIDGDAAKNAADLILKLIQKKSADKP